VKNFFDENSGGKRFTLDFFGFSHATAPLRMAIPVTE
jgi:hypothetical protein